MKKLNKKDFYENKIYNELFHPNNPLGLDGETESPEEYFAWIESQKYSEKEKGDVIRHLVENYDFSNKDIFNRIKKCLPNGLNSRYSIEDSEYEALKKEFNI